MHLGAHVGGRNPLKKAQDRSVELVQFFLGDSQAYPRVFQCGRRQLPCATARASRTFHVPYVINVTALNGTRIPSPKVFDQQTAVAALRVRPLA